MSESIDGFMLTQEQLHEEIAGQAKVIKSMIDAEPKTDFAPMLLVMAKERPEDEAALYAHVLMVPFNESKDKRHALMSLGKGFYQQKLIPVSVILASECWVSTIQANPDGSVPEHGQPRHDPNRREAIQISGMCMNKHRAMTMAEMTREEGDEPQEGEPDTRTFTIGDFMEVKENPGPCILDAFYHGFFEVMYKNMKESAPNN